jgi:hypothetical protein
MSRSPDAHVPANTVPDCSLALLPSRAMGAREPAWRCAGRRRAAAWGLGASIGIHVLAYWLAPGLAEVWREPAVLAYAIGLEAAVPSAGPKAPADTARSRPAPARRALPVEVAPRPDRDAVRAIDLDANEVSALTEALVLGGVQRAEDALQAIDVALPVTVQATAPAAESAVAAGDTPQVTGGFDLPTRVSIHYRATSSITDGVAHYSFRREGGKYETESTLEATGFFISMFAGVMHQVSRGDVHPGGLRPDRFTLRRGDAAPERAEFRHALRELVLMRRGETRAQPLPSGLQDTQSFVFHLAYLLANRMDAAAPIDVLVTNARKVYRHRFMVIGTVQVPTDWGMVEAVHLRSDAANREDVYEVWLSPQQHYLPIRIKFFAGRFPIELIATSIRSTP